MKTRKNSTILTQAVIFSDRFANDEVYFTSAKSPLPLFAKEGDWIEGNLNFGFLL